MRELGVDDDTILTTVSVPGSEEGTTVLEKVPVFTCDGETGDIQILVTRLDGSYIEYDVPTTLEDVFKKEKYMITRYVLPKGDMKYGIPKDAGV